MKICAKLLLFSQDISCTILVIVLFFTCKDEEEIRKKQIINQLRSIASLKSSRVEGVISRNLERLKLVTSRTQLRLRMAVDGIGTKYPGRREL